MPFWKRLSRAKQVAQKPALALTGVLFILIFLEGAVRVFNLKPHSIDYYGDFRLVDNLNIVYEFIPGVKVDGSIINLQGFKDYPFVQKKEKDVVRITMLGDSVTQGIQVPLGKTFSDLLEVSLNEKALRLGRNHRYEVMNFGVCGYNLAAEVEILKTKVISYAPDIVILNYYYNDSDSIPGYHMFVIDKDTRLTRQQRNSIIKKYYNLSRLTKIFKRILNHSQLYLFIVDRMNTMQANLFAAPTFFKKHYGDTMNQAESDAVSSSLKEIKQLSRQYGFKVLVCLHSFLLYGEHPNNSLFAKLLEDEGLSYFRIFDHYKNRHSDPSDSKLFGFDHCHLNEQGHALVAEAMLAELEKNRLVDLKNNSVVSA